MKKTTLFSALKQNLRRSKHLFFVVFMLVSLSSQSQTYCSPESGGCLEVGEIVNVTFAGISNTSTCSEAYSSYSDFTNYTSAYVVAGLSYDLSVTISSHLGNQHVAVWFDYDNNGTFDASEFTNLGTSPAAGSIVTASITIPVTATVGNIRMRVKAQHDQAIAATSSCAIPYLGNGEYEDYSVNILSPISCSGTPIVGAAISSKAIACQETPFVLTAESIPAVGLSYQWQLYIDQWENLGDPQTTLNYIVTDQARPASYRVIVTCVESGLSATSEVISVGQFGTDGCYCINSINFNCKEGDMITNVNIRELNLTSTCGNRITGYTNYLARTVSPTFHLGETIPVSVSVGPPTGYGWIFESVGIWIDYNRNGVFEQTEYTYVGTGFNQALTGTITIPAVTNIGHTRMRVMVAAVQAVDFGHQFACGPILPENNLGEIEDYSVMIAPPLSTPGFENASVSIYPNPTNGLVNIQFAELTDVDTINVFSISGQLVYSKQFSGSSDTYTIDLAKAATGVYTMKLESENGTIIKRLVKN